MAYLDRKGFALSATIETDSTLNLLNCVIKEDHTFASSLRLSVHLYRICTFNQVKTKMVKHFNFVC